MIFREGDAPWVFGVILGMTFAGAFLLLMIGNPDWFSSTILFIFTMISALVSAFCSWRLGLGDSLKSDERK